jgi:hypothetical protein
MHTCQPPKKVLNKWLKSYDSTIEGYGHLLLEQKIPNDDEIESGLVPYFESAHADARAVFHKYAGISLHPDDGAPGCHAQYPKCLPPITRSGLFGEVLSGMLTEAFPFIGEHQWIVPVFLFRKHEDVAQYMFTLSRDRARVRQVLGRKGDDFIGLAVDKKGSVTRVIAGEAKWRKTWNQSTLDAVMLGEKIVDPSGGGKKINNGKGVWFEINRALNPPMGLKQLQDILIELAPDEYAETILSLDRVLALENQDAIERTDLILLVGGGAASREAGDALLEIEEVPDEYEAGRDLQVVEIILNDGGHLITNLYDRLFADGGDDADD